MSVLSSPLSRRQFFFVSATPLVLTLPGQAFASLCPTLRPRYSAFRRIAGNKINVCVVDRSQDTGDAHGERLARRFMSKRMRRIELTSRHLPPWIDVTIHDLQHAMVKEALARLWRVSGEEIQIRFGKYFLGDLHPDKRERNGIPVTDPDHTAYMLRGGRYGGDRMAHVSWTTVSYRPPHQVEQPYTLGMIRARNQLV